MHKRFFVDFKIFDKKEIIINDKDFLHQLVSVFRAKEGEEIVLLDNSGFEYRGIIKNIGKKEVVAEIVEKMVGKEQKIELNIFQSIIKKDNMELALAKCTEIGIAGFTPILAEHCVKLNLNFERLAKVAKEASEQCGRAKLPEISEIMDFKKVVEMAGAKKDVANFIFHEEKDKCCDSPPHLSDINNNSVFNINNSNKKVFCSGSHDYKCGGKLSCDFLKNFFPSACHPERSERTDIKKFNLFIGPEGGFSDKEIELVKSNSFYVLSLGDLILRSETAGLAAGFMILNQ